MRMAVALLLLAGCGTGTVAASGGEEPVTPRALAAVAAEHAGAPDSASEESDAAEEFRRDGVGAELRYGSTGEYDGDALVVAVGRGLPPELVSCGEEDLLDGCVELDGGVLAWEDEAPEEDPGVVYLALEKGRSTVLLFYAGPVITGDPRDLDLPVSVDTLLAIAKDPRVDLTTSQAALDAGLALDQWR